MEEETLPKLRKSREGANKKIQERIDEGQLLHDRPINSETELDEAEADFKNWSVLKGRSSCSKRAVKNLATSTG